MIRNEASADAYDAHHSDGEFVSAERTIHQALYRTVCLHVRPSQKVLEVGCGTGALAQCLLAKMQHSYRGFDFSPVAIRRARMRTGRDDCFFVGDARRAESYQQPYDTIVCLEVLEHIERDLDVIANWNSGCACICSVPNFDYPTHVRWFRHETDIVSRYGDLISIRKIERISCPLVRGRGWRAYLRQLRWSRHDPWRLMGLLGYRSFDNFAGWFLFCGTRR